MVQPEDVIENEGKDNLDILKTLYTNTRNKKRRQEIFGQIQQIKRASKLKKRRTKDSQSGVAKQIPTTIENSRPIDLTTMTSGDAETAADLDLDELSAYFDGSVTPKVIITTQRKKVERVSPFCAELARLIPNSLLMVRRRMEIGSLTEQAIANDVTVIIVVNQDGKIPNGLIVSHLPDGPTARFRLSNVKLRGAIKSRAKMGTGFPEILLSNFTTRLGTSIARLFGAVFHQIPDFRNRRVVTFRNQRDFVFFRQHRYVFVDKERVALQEVGPRFTLKLRSLQKGVFGDPKEYIWFFKRHEMETGQRKRFYL